MLLSSFSILSSAITCDQIELYPFVHVAASLCAKVGLVWGKGSASGNYSSAEQLTKGTERVSTSDEATFYAKRPGCRLSRSMVAH